MDEQDRKRIEEAIEGLRGVNYEIGSALRGIRRRDLPADVREALRAVDRARGRIRDVATALRLRFPKPRP